MVSTNASTSGQLLNSNQKDQVLGLSLTCLGVVFGQFSVGYPKADAQKTRVPSAVDLGVNSIFGDVQATKKEDVPTEYVVQTDLRTNGQNSP